MKVTLYNTVTGRNNQIGRTLSEAAPFLVSHLDSIILDTGKQHSLVFQEERILDTAISKVYKGLMRTDALKQITLIDLSGVSNVPPILTTQWISLDVKALASLEASNYRALSSISAYRDKILIDFSRFYNHRSRKINDSTRFQGRILKALLARSYENFEGGVWLNPQLIYFLTKIYARMVSSRISRKYNLDVFAQQRIEAIAAVYFANKCTDSEEVVPPIIHKMDFLRRVDVDQIISRIRTDYEKFGIDEMIDAIVKFSSEHVSKFNLATFFEMTINVSTSQMESLLTIEHPAYFLYTLLEAESGSKTSTYHSLVTLNLRKDVKEMVNILSTGSLIAKDV